MDGWRKLPTSVRQRVVQDETSTNCCLSLTTVLSGHPNIHLFSTNKVRDFLLICHVLFLHYCNIILRFFFLFIFCKSRSHLLMPENYGLYFMKIKTSWTLAGVCDRVKDLSWILFRLLMDPVIKTRVILVWNH